MREPLQNGQDERGGLAGAGLSGAPDVATGDDGRNRGRLDRRGHLVSEIDHRTDERCGETERGEGVHFGARGACNGSRSDAVKTFPVVSPEAIEPRRLSRLDLSKMDAYAG